MVDGELLPQSVLRQIGDQRYEKRKVAALDVEQTVKKLALANDQQRIRLVIDKLIADYSFSPQPNFRKGALLCLAAATVGLGEPTEAHLHQIVPAVIKSFTDPDSRVRYYACEALYNIAKVARDTFMPHFNDTFLAMFRLCADSDPHVQQAVQFLDNLIKDIVTASPNFRIDQFIPKLKEYLTVTAPEKRQFLINWITVLDSVPDLDMLAYLPQLLDGLMNMLSDSNHEIRFNAHKAMMEFLVEIQATRTIELGSIACILVDKASSQDDLTRQTALKWLKEFVAMSPRQLLDHYAEILGAVLPNISHANKEIQQTATEANAALLMLPPDDEGGGSVDTAAILATVSRELKSEQEPTRLEAIRWIHFLLKRNQAAVLTQMEMLMPALLDALSAPSERVVLQSLSVLAALANHPEHFRPVLMSLLDRFRGSNGAAILQKGGSLVIRRLCAYMGAEKVFKEFASILDAEQDLGFASLMVQALNLILLTSSEVRPLKEALREARSNPQGAQLFAALYPSWSHSAGAVLSLCFLSAAYQHACDIVHCFSTLALGPEVLVQIDRLVTLLETPTFAFLRLQLLQPGRHPSLLRAMYGLLALLPQSSAFRTLSARLESMDAQVMLQLEGLKQGNKGEKESQENWTDFALLLKSFVSRQKEHAYADERQKAIQEGWIDELEATQQAAAAAAVDVKQES